MNRTLKKVLSFVLALAMVVIATVPAFAATGVVDPAEPNDKQVNFCVTKGGLKVNKLAETKDGKGDINWTSRGEYKLTDGNYLDENTTYVVQMDEADVEEGTPNKFAITTDAKGKVSLIKAITEKVVDGKTVVVNEVALDAKAGDECQFEFKLDNPAAEEGYTIYTRLANGERVETDTRVRVYPVKTVGEAGAEEYAYADGSAINQVDYDEGQLRAYTVPAGSRTTDSALKLTGAALTTAQGLKTKDHLPIVAIVAAGKDGRWNTDDDVIVFTNFSKDKQAVLTMNDESLRDVRVIVRGLNNPTVAVPGATVEIQKNSTQLFGPESFGEAIAKGTTDKNGEARFTDIKIEELLKYLSDSSITLNGDDYVNAFNEITLPFRAVVTSADGYTVPVGVTLTPGAFKGANNDIIYIDLVPTNANKLVKRIAGDNRMETSVEVAKKLYPNKADLGANQFNVPESDPLFGKKTIILANGFSFPDALTGNGLTKYYDAPILLSNGTTIDKSVQKFIDDYDVEGAIILGGTTAMSGELETALEKQGITTTRLAGANRYGTSAAVAQRIVALNGGVLPMHEVETDKVTTRFQAFVASGEDFADALVASVPAAIYGAPILLTRKASVPAETAKVIDDYKVISAIVVGGDAAITPSTYANLNIATKERIYGENRQLTSMRVAERFFPQAGSAYVAGGLRFPDALVGGALSAKNEAPILLSNSADLTAAVRDYIVKHKITDVTILGGPNAVSLTVEGQLEKAVLDASK